MAAVVTGAGVLSSLSLILAAGPLAMVVRNLRLYRPPLAQAGLAPSVSVLIPARNEEGNIGAAAAAVLASRGVPDLDLIVLDDESTDRTPDILAAIADPRLRVIAAGPLPPGWSGKQHACRMLAQAARHDLLVFVDADVRLTADAVHRMAGFMAARPDVGLASGVPRQITSNWLDGLLVPLIHCLLLGFLPISLMRHRLDPGLGAGCGQLFIARRDAYTRSGGHAAIRASLHDGITLPRAFRRAGIATDLFDATPIAACRMFDSARATWRGLGRNATEGIARPVALPVWTAILAGGSILPFILLPRPLAACAVLAAWIGRIALAIRFRQDWRSALLHPIGIALLLAVQWNALWRAGRGRPSIWRGRAYVEPG